jgi:hypothetical protein
MELLFPSGTAAMRAPARLDRFFHKLRALPGPLFRRSDQIGNKGLLHGDPVAFIKLA